MSRIVDVFVPLDASDEPLAPLISRTLGIPREQLRDLRVLRRSLDARKAHALGHRLRVEILAESERVSGQATSPAPPRWPASIQRGTIVSNGFKTKGDGG